MGKRPAGGHVGLFLEQVPGHHLDGTAGILTVGVDEDVRGTGPEEVSQERPGPKGHSALPGWYEQEWVEQSTWQEVGWGVVSSFRTVDLHSWQDPNRRWKLQLLRGQNGKSKVGGRCLGKQLGLH